jgi:hypothetical protein
MGEPEDQYDTLKRLAAEGDLVGVVGMSVRMRGMLRATTQANFFRTAIESAQAKGLLTDRVLGMALEIASEMYLRLGTVTIERLHLNDCNAGTELAIPKETLADMERLARIEDRIIQLARARVAISHVTTLSERGPVRERPGRVISIDEARSSKPLSQAAGE